MQFTNTNEDMWLMLKVVGTQCSNTNQLHNNTDWAMWYYSSSQKAACAGLYGLNTFWTSAFLTFAYCTADKENNMSQWHECWTEQKLSLKEIVAQLIKYTKFTATTTVITAPSKSVF